jgi:hypothetical protein
LERNATKTKEKSFDVREICLAGEILILANANFEFSPQSEMPRSSMIFIGLGEPHALRLGMRVHQHLGHIFTEEP